MLACVARRARAGVTIQTAQRAGATIEARVRVARVGYRYLAQRRRETDGARAPEGGTGRGRSTHFAGAPVLTTWARPRVTWVQVLAVFPHVHRRAIAERLSSRHAGSTILARVGRTRH